MQCFLWHTVKYLTRDLILLRIHFPLKPARALKARVSILKNQVTRMNVTLLQALKNTRNRKPRKPLDILRYTTGRIPRKFPGVHRGLQVFPPNGAIFYLAQFKFFQTQNQMILSNWTFSSLTLRINLILEAE